MATSTFENQLIQLSNQMNIFQSNMNIIFNLLQNQNPPKGEEPKKKTKKMSKTIMHVSSTNSSGNSNVSIVTSDSNEIIFRNKSGEEIYRTYNRLSRTIIKYGSEMHKINIEFPNDFYVNCFDGPILIAYRDSETNSIVYSTRTWVNALMQSWKKGSPTFGEYMTKIIPSLENAHIDNIEAVFEKDETVKAAVVQLVAPGHFLSMEFSPDQQPGVWLIMTTHFDGSSKTHIPTFTDAEVAWANISNSISVVRVDGTTHIPQAIYCSEMVFNREAFTYGARTERDIVNNLFSLVRAMVNTRGQIENDRSYQFLATTAYPNINYVAQVIYERIIKIKPNFEKNPFLLNIPRFVFEFLTEINIGLNLDNLIRDYYIGHDVYCHVVMELCARGANSNEIRDVIIPETQTRNKWDSFSNSEIDRILESNPKKFDELSKACRDLARTFNKKNIANEIFKFTQRKAFSELTNSFYTFADVLNA